MINILYYIAVLEPVPRAVLNGFEGRIKAYFRLVLACFEHTSGSPDGHGINPRFCHIVSRFSA